MADDNTNAEEWNITEVAAGFTEALIKELEDSMETITCPYCGAKLTVFRIFDKIKGYSKVCKCDICNQEF